MGNGIMNKIKSLFNRKKNENKNEEIKVEKQQLDSTKIEEKQIKPKIKEKEIKPKFEEKKTSRGNYSKENKTNNSKNTYSSIQNRTKQPRDSKSSNEDRIKHTRKNDKEYNNSRDKNKKTYNDKKSIERKIHDNKSTNKKYNSNNGRLQQDKKNHISEIENLIKDISVGMEFEGESFKGEILKKQSFNLSYSTGTGEKYTLTYKELTKGYVQMRKTGSIDEKWYEANFNDVGSSNLRMIRAILKKYITP
ncbi:hypothetical protein [Oceanirhabdus seepicola]|uniref:Uncharacterized protein n=1 Tax=Oceanirhabdus seepicola TaxID=2828781 RepID=A0A9J6P2W7_9CLOT|nr:hypothetical protein [Oceanirhabdus seepicola]MCM1990959.1 hypothetical protein [Oceanirhabdus seepicola]